MLHMAWTASLAADNDNIWWSSFDGTTWSPPELLADRQSSTSPALAAVNDRLYMAWKGIGDDTLWWSSFDGCVRTETTGSNKTCWALLPPSFWMLGHQHHGRKRFQSLTEQIALVGKGNLLLHGGPDPKVLAHFIEGSAEA
jgi:hypothetical protein